MRTSSFVLFCGCWLYGVTVSPPLSIVAVDAFSTSHKAQRMQSSTASVPLTATTSLGLAATTAISSPKEKSTAAESPVAPSSLEMKATATNGDDNDEDLDFVEFPPPLSPFDQFKRAASFWSTAVPIIANYYGLIGNVKLQELLGTSLDEENVEVCISSFEI